MKIYIASDHAGYELKNELLHFLELQGNDVSDCGPYEFNREDDYPDYVAEAASNVSQDPERTFGIIIGGSGQGEAIMANRFPNVRATVYNGQCKPADGRAVPDAITIMREHNDSNILSLGAWYLTNDEAKEAVIKWLSTPFRPAERHTRRLHKIEALAPHSASGTEASYNY